MKRFFLAVCRFWFAHAYTSTWLRDMLMWPVASRVFKMCFDDTVVLKTRVRMKTTLDDMLGRLIIFYGPTHEYFWEPATLSLSQKLVARARTALVAGSHIGYMALEIRKAMPQDSILYTFEPIPYLYDISYKNIMLNKHIGEIVLDKRALSNADGEALMRDNNIKSKIDERGDRKVETVTIDSFMKEKRIESADFVLLDVEGHELNVLRGARKLLGSNGIPKHIIFEVINSNTALWSQIKDLLEKHGYSFFVIDDDYSLSFSKKYIRAPKLLSTGDMKNIRHKYINILATLCADGDLKKFLK